MPETSVPVPDSVARAAGTVWLSYGGSWWAAVTGLGLTEVSAPGAVWTSRLIPNAAAEPGWSSTQTGGVDG